MKLDELWQDVQRIKNDVASLFKSDTTIRNGRWIGIVNGSDTDGNGGELGNDPDGNAAAGTGVFFSAFGETFSGVVYQVGAVAAGVLQAGFNTAGKFIAGAEAVTLDADGITIDNVSSYASRNAIVWADTANSDPAAQIYTTYQPVTVSYMGFDVTYRRQTLSITAEDNTVGRIELSASGPASPLPGNGETYISLNSEVVKLISSGLTLPEIAAPSTPASGYGVLYHSNDTIPAPFFVDDTGLARPAFTDHTGRFAKLVDADFYIATSADRLTAAAIGAGTVALTTSLPKHPGMVTATQSGANTGYEYYVNGGGFLSLDAGYNFDVMFNLSSVTATVMRFGFWDAAGTAAPTDGAYIHIAAATLDGRTYSNTNTSTTATSYTVSTGTWYHARVYINSTSLVTFTLFDEAGTVLWTNTLAANIPSGVGRETSAGVKAYKTSVGTVDLVIWDAMIVSAPLVR